jgi:diguanylate cyclase (GGDEF)-like protein
MVIHMINLIALPIIVAGSFSLLFSFLFIFLSISNKNHERDFRSYLVFAILSFSNFLFSLGFSLLVSVSDDMFWLSFGNRLTIASGGFNICFFMHFAYLKFKVQRRWDLKAIYAVNVIFVILSLIDTPLFMQNRFTELSIYYNSLFYGPIMQVWGGYIILIMAYLVIRLFSLYFGGRRRKERKRDPLIIVLAFGAFFWMLTGVADAVTAITPMDLPPLTWLGSMIMILPISFVLLTKINFLYKQIQDLYQQVSHDSLTSVHSRRFFELEFENAFREVGEKDYDQYLIMLDIDNFKHINDVWGHLAGDLAIKSLGSLLMENLREDDIVARFGGDEFVVLIASDIRPGNINSIVERLRTKVERNTVLYEKERLSFTCSFGIAQFNKGTLEEGITLEATLEAADKALYESKKKGKNSITLQSTG